MRRIELTDEQKAIIAASGKKLVIFKLNSDQVRRPSIGKCGRNFVKAAIVSWVVFDLFWLIAVFGCENNKVVDSKLFKLYVECLVAVSNKIVEII